MKISKKLLSGILTVCVVMSTLSLTAFATETVSALNLTMDKPQAGAAPATAATVAEAAAEVLSIKWSPADPVFQEGKTYTATIQIGIKSGVDAAFADSKSMSANMNGNKIHRITVSGNTATVKYGWILRTADSSADSTQKAEPSAAQSSGTPKAETTKNETAKAENTKSAFSDVRDADYYSDAVRWAVDKKITTGTSSTTFSPEDTCTRAQILTFLWRAVGSPKYESFMAFNDVVADDYFFNAATWSKSKNMVSGNSFAPDTPCTRAYTVIYLWKNAGSPDTDVSSVFSDVDPNADYAPAVAWAVKNGVTSGTSATTFSPNDTCTRGQIVTFLNRALGSGTGNKDKTDQNTNVTELPKSDDKTETKDPTKTDEVTNTTDTKKDTENPSDTTKTDTTKDDTTKTDPSTKTDDTTVPKYPTTVDEMEKVVQIREKYDTAKYEAAVKKALREALGDNLGSNMTQLQKALLLHDWLLLNCQYDTTKMRKYAYCEYGAIVEGLAVCSGYTRAYNDLLSRVGIDAEFVYGFLNREAHAWSRVTIDGKKYHVDVTADDPVPDAQGRVEYVYFLVSDKKLSGHTDYKLHCTDTKYDNNQLLRGYPPRFIWDERINKFYYVDMTEVKTTSDFTESLKPSNSQNGAKPTSVLMTADGKYFCFFKPSFTTSEYPMYLYSIETGDYYTYTVTGVKDIIFDRLIQNGNNIEPSRDYYKNSLPYMTKADAKIPLPGSNKKRYVTFDANYSGGKTTSSEYLNAYWTNGDGSFDELTRKGYTFGGWYTAKDGGTKVESYDDIKGDNVTLYARWWTPWTINEEPTLTETGKAARTLDGAPSVKEEITLPVLGDTSVWERTMNVSSTTTSHGKQKYSSVYGEVSVILPLKDPEPLKYGIVYKNGSVFITVEEESTYNVEFESKTGGETVSTGKMRVISNGPGEYRVVYPKSFTPSGTVTATLYDSGMNKICSVEYEVK